MGESSRLILMLADDGTLDRVYVCHCRACGESWEERFCNDGEGFPSKAECKDMAEEAHAQWSEACYA